MTRLGVDTSDFQVVNSLPVSVHFVVRKGGEGLRGQGYHVGADRCDQDIATSRRGLWGRTRGVAIYWFFHPAESPLLQANLAIACARRNRVRGVAIDCEVADGCNWVQIEVAMRRFLAIIESAGLAVLLYDNVSWLEALGAEKWGYPVWKADPSNVGPELPCVCVQVGIGYIPGIVGDCDLDHWVGGSRAFREFFHGAKKRRPPRARGNPTIFQLRRANMVALRNPGQADIAKRNRWHLYVWDATHFAPQVGGEPGHATLYANRNFRRAA